MKFTNKFYKDQNNSIRYENWEDELLEAGKPTETEDGDYWYGYTIRNKGRCGNRFAYIGIKKNGGLYFTTLHRDKKYQVTDDVLARMVEQYSEWLIYMVKHGYVE